MAPQKRSAALVISAFVDTGAKPCWYARLSSYGDVFSPAVTTVSLSSVDAVSKAVTIWLESVIGPQISADDSRVTAP